MGSGVGVHTEEEVGHLTPKQRKQLKDHVAKQAVAQIRRLIGSDPTLLQHLAEHEGLNKALRRTTKTKLKGMKKKKKKK